MQSKMHVAFYGKTLDLLCIQGSKFGQQIIEQWQTLGANFMFLTSLLNETCLILHVLPKKL